MGFSHILGTSNSDDIGRKGITKNWSSRINYIKLF